MRSFGFSTGALAKGNFRAGVELQRPYGVRALELSALRSSELTPLVEAAGDLNLDGFDYVSVHAPSDYNGLDERDVVAMLRELPASWPIVLHPDVVVDSTRWRFFGDRLCMENMDQRKSRGRTVPEMELIFRMLPEAGFCFDIGHARQVDPTMGVAIGLLQKFRARLREVHMSEVDPYGRHIPISFAASCSFRRVARFIPEDCPVILESTVEPGSIELELETASRALSLDTALTALS